MYLLDANVFIEAKNTYYRFDTFPGFWNWLDAEQAKGHLGSIQPIRDELLKGNDELADWIKARKDSGWFLPVDDIETQLAVLTTYCGTDALCLKAVSDAFVAAGTQRAYTDGAADGLKLVSDGLAGAVLGLPALNDGATAIRDGLGAAEGGAAALLGGAVAVQDGVAKVGAGLDALSAGLGAAVAGVLALSAGAEGARTGSATISDGLGSLSAGAGALAVGAGQLADGTGAALAGSEPLAEGAAALATGLGAAKAGSAALAAGADTLSVGLRAAKAGSAALTTGTKALADGLVAAADGSVALADGSSALADGLVAAADGAGALADGLVAAAGGAPALRDGAKALQENATSKLVTQLQDASQASAVMYATVEASAKRAETEAMVAGAPEGAVALASYSFEIDGATKGATDNALAALALLGLVSSAGALQLVRRRSG